MHRKLKAGFHQGLENHEGKGINLHALHDLHGEMHLVLKLIGAITTQISPFGGRAE